VTRHGHSLAASRAYRRTRLLTDLVDVDVGGIARPGLLHRFFDKSELESGCLGDGRRVYRGRLLTKKTAADAQLGDFRRRPFGPGIRVPNEPPGAAFSSRAPKGPRPTSTRPKTDRLGSERCQHADHLASYQAHDVGEIDKVRSRRPEKSWFSRVAVAGSPDMQSGWRVEKSTVRGAPACTHLLIGLSRKRNFQRTARAPASDGSSRCPKGIAQWDTEGWHRRPRRSPRFVAFTAPWVSEARQNGC
jgi:hypothetical protein